MQDSDWKAPSLQQISGLSEPETHKAAVLRSGATNLEILTWFTSWVLPVKLVGASLQMKNSSFELIMSERSIWVHLQFSNMLKALTETVALVLTQERADLRVSTNEVDVRENFPIAGEVRIGRKCQSWLRVCLGSGYRSLRGRLLEYFESHQYFLVMLFLHAFKCGLPARSVS